MRSVLFGVAALLVLACGGSPEKPTPVIDGGVDAGTDAGTDAGIPERDFGLTVAPASVAAPLGGSVRATVTLTRVGDVGEISLSARDLPVGVTALFSPTPVPAGERESQLTLQVGTDAQVGTSTLTLVASWEGQERTLPLDLTVQTLTVTGKVRSGAVGATVGLVGKGTTTTESDGTFTFTDVTPPYDLYTVGSIHLGGVSQDVVNYYQGLTRADPTVEVAGNSVKVLNPKTATLSGTLSGSALPLSPASILFHVWSGEDSVSASSSGGLSYSHSVSWNGSAFKDPGTLYVLQLKAEDDTLSYSGYAAFAVALNDGDNATVDLNLTQPETARATGSLTVPPGFPVPSISLYQHFGAKRYFLASQNLATPDLPIPVIPAGTATVYASTKLGNVTSELSFSNVKTDVELVKTFPSPPQFTSPANGAGSIHGSTPFTWTAPPNSVSRIQVQVGQVLYNVFTAATSIAIPQVPEKTFPLTDNGTWSVDVYGPFNQVDRIAGPKGVDLESDDFRFHVNSDGTRAFVWSN